MVLAEHFPRNGPLHFQANNIPAGEIMSFGVSPVNYSERKPMSLWRSINDSVIIKLRQP